MNAAACRICSRFREHMEILAPSLASSSATARPRPLLDAATIATLFFRPRSTSFSSQVGVGFVQPILSWRTKDIDVERIFDCDRGMDHVGGDMHNLPFRKQNLPPVYREFQRPFQDVRHLFVVVAMGGN